jgi:hypothetical protein
MLRQSFYLVMSEERNGLRHLPKIVKFQLMTYLALMWSVVFGVWSGMIVLIGPSMAAHAILILGVFFTADLFRRAQEHPAATHRDKFRDPADGGVRYDDIWGA